MAESLNEPLEIQSQHLKDAERSYTPSYDPAANAIGSVARVLAALAELMYSMDFRNDVRAAFASFNANDALENVRSADPTLALVAELSTNELTAYNVGPKRLYLVGVIIRSVKTHEIIFTWALRDAADRNAGTASTSKKNVIRILIPALGTIFPEKAEPGWMKYYQLVGVNVSRGAVGAAVHTLNGSNMYDILRILNRLASDKPGPAAFNRLLNEYAGISGVGHLRLGLAFAAVLARSAGKSAWTAFRERFPSVSTLADFEQKDIEQFIEG